MNYPKWNLITAILLILGVHPLGTRRRTLHWYRKIHFIGIWFCGLQIIFSAYTIHMEMHREAYHSLNSNNIMHGAVITKRMIGIGFPFVTIAALFLKRESTEKFFERIDRFDVFLRSNTENNGEIDYVGDVRKLNYKLQRVNFLSGIFIIVLEFINVVIGAGTGRAQGQGTPKWETFYFFHSSILIHIAVAQNIYVKFYGVTLRQELFSAFVANIFESTQSTHTTAKNYRRLCLNRVIQQRIRKRFQ